MNVIAARLFARCMESSHAPFIAVLGPPGSGKTPLLRVVYRKLQTQKDVLPLFVNMRRLSLGSELQMEAQLASLLVKEIEGARAADIASLQLRQTATLSQLLEDICRHCHRRVLVFFDQFDSVPHYFSRAVSRQIRSLYEKSATDLNLARLGVLIAGVVSIFSLKRETDSAFAFFSTEALPPNSIRERISAIQDQIPKRMALPASTIRWLADHCGPDPAFLGGIVEKIKSGSKSSRRVSTARLSRLTLEASPGSTLLRDIAIHVWRDPYLFDVVKQLLEKNGRVAIHEPIVDVPMFQLLGIVRVEEDSYVFRNRIVENHVKSICEVIAQCSPSLTPQQILRLQSKTAQLPGAYDMLILDSCKRALRQADSIEHINRILGAVWRQLRNGEDPQIEVSVDIEGDGRPSQQQGQPEPAGSIASTAARRLQRTAFGWDSTRVAVCVPIKMSHASAYVTVIVGRGQLQGDFSDSALIVWTQMLADIRGPIIAHAVLSKLSTEKMSANSFAAIGASSEHIDEVNTAPSMHMPAIKILEDVLIQVAFEQSEPTEFVRDLVDRANLQGGVRIAAIRHVNGAPDAAIRRLLRWALDTGKAPDDPATSLLQRLTTGVLDELGIDQRRLLISALVQLPLHANSAVELMATQFSVPLPAVSAMPLSGPGMLTDLQPEEQLQTFLRRRDEFLDVGLLTKALERSHAVCLISLPEMERYGTGVFVQEDLVITNYHVLEVGGKLRLSGAARVQLGYTSETLGVTCELHSKGLVAASPTNALDYAILRLAKNRPGGLKFADPREHRTKSAVHILQHPRGESMKLSLSHNGLVSIDKDRGTLTYVTTTAGGSSGAPCFDEDWNLIGIHRAEKATSFGSVREGILLEAICADAKLLGLRV